MCIPGRIAREDAAAATVGLAPSPPPPSPSLVPPCLLRAMAAALVADLHGQLLRELAAGSGIHFVGLRAAAAHYRRARLIDNRLSKQLTRLDDTFAVIRHITDVSAKKLVQDVVLCLNQSAEKTETEKTVRANQIVEDLDASIQSVRGISSSPTSTTSRPIGSSPSDCLNTKQDKKKQLVKSAHIACPSTSSGAQSALACDQLDVDQMDQTDAMQENPTSSVPGSFYPSARATTRSATGPISTPISTPTCLTSSAGLLPQLGTPDMGCSAISGQDQIGEDSQRGKGLMSTCSSDWPSERPSVSQLVRQIELATPPPAFHVPCLARSDCQAARQMVAWFD